MIYKGAHRQNTARIRTKEGGSLEGNHEEKKGSARETTGHGRNNEVASGRMKGEGRDGQEDRRCSSSGGRRKREEMKTMDGIHVLVVLVKRRGRTGRRRKNESAYRRVRLEILGENGETKRRVTTDNTK